MARRGLVRSNHPDLGYVRLDQVAEVTIYPREGGLHYGGVVDRAAVTTGADGLLYSGVPLGLAPWGVEGNVKGFGLDLST